MTLENSPTHDDVIFYREDTDQSVSFTLSVLAADVTGAKCYVRDKIDGTLLVAVNYATAPSQFALVDGEGLSSVGFTSDNLSPVPAGFYYYDIQITTATVIVTEKRGRFELVGNISTDVEEDSPPDGYYYVQGEDYSVAIQGAASPSALNVFATMADIAAYDTLAEVLANGNTTGANDIIVSDGQGIKTALLAGNTAVLSAYDVDGGGYVDFLTLTANNTPTADLRTDVTIGGAYVYRAGGTDIPVADGGTGASTPTAGFDALSPMTTLGDLIYGGASGANARLTGNITTTKKCLSQTGDGANSAAPAWAQIAAADLSNGVTGSGAVVLETSPTITTAILAGSTTMALLNTTATTIYAFGAATPVYVTTTGIGIGDPSVGGILQVNVATASNDGLILKSLDDSFNRNLLEIQRSNGVVIGGIKFQNQIGMGYGVTPWLGIGREPTSIFDLYAVNTLSDAEIKLTAAQNTDALVNLRTIVGGGSYQWYIGVDATDSGSLKISTDGIGITDEITFNTVGSMALRTGGIFPSGGGSPVIVMADAGSNPSGISANTAGFFAKDVSGTTEAFAFDESGNVNQLSAHDKDNRWVHYSYNVNTGKRIRVDMESLVEAVEILIGKQFMVKDFYL